MAKASPAITSFNGGELTPLMDAQINTVQYQSGASLIKNMIPLVQGPVTRRAGTRFVAEAKDSDDKILLVKFRFSESAAYVLEFGDLYVRFYTEGGQLLSSGLPVEVVTPYAIANFYDSEGLSLFNFAQSGDILYIFHPSYPPYLLRRTSLTTFTMTIFETKGGPFQDVDPDNTVTMTASAVTGTGITLTAGSNTFVSGHVGTYLYLEDPLDTIYKEWEANKFIANATENPLGEIRRNDGKVYECVTDQTVSHSGVEARTGTNPPIHDQGVVADGDGEPIYSGATLFAEFAGVDWEFLHAGYGWVKITAVTNGTTATADVVSRLPASVVSGTTTRWAFSAWSSIEGYPSSVTFFRNRLAVGRAQRLWFSTTAGYDDFNRRNRSGEIVDNQAIVIDLASGEINDIQWLFADKALLAGTAGGEFAISELSNGDPLGPGNIQARLQSRHGVRNILPVADSGDALFLQNSGKILREIAFDFASDGYATRNMSVIAEHLLKGGITQMAFAKEPYAIVWMVRSDGKLIGLTWNNEQKVFAWHQHALGGTNAVVESVTAIPYDGRDQVWLSVRRTVNGATVRYVEYMELEYQDGDALTTQFYVDSGLTYSGASTKNISGLDHLEGEDVVVLANGAPSRVSYTVNSGAITLQDNATHAVIGLGYESQLKTMRIEAGAADGTAQGKTKRFHKIVFRFLSSAGCLVGWGDTFDEVETRTSADLMDQPVPLFNGDYVKFWNHGYDREGKICIKSSNPTALTLVGIFPQLHTQDA